MNKKSEPINFKVVIGTLVVVVIVLCGAIVLKNSVFTQKKDSNVADVENKDDLKNGEKSSKDSGDENQKSDAKSDNKSNETSDGLAKCYGTYKHDNITFTLKSDGTFKSDFSGVSGTTGVFSINDNTVSLTGKKDTVGPREEDPYYHTSDYVIGDDCSYILYTEDGSSKAVKLVSTDAKKGNGIQKKVKCEGTYTAKNIKYVLKSDGTFESDFSGTSGTTGVFSINDNAVSFTGKKHTVGPREEDPYYDSADYVISDDCSQIKYRSGDTVQTLTRE